MSDYLWNKSGEPDEELERLEQKLGQLGYQKRPLALPVQAGQPFASRRAFSPYLAAAAVLLFLLLAGGMWLVLQRDARQQNEDQQAAKSRPDAGPEQRIVPGANPANVTGVQNNDSSPPKPVETVATSPTGIGLQKGKASRVSRRTRRLSNSMIDEKALARRRRGAASEREGEIAKAQLILALHIASDKLNEAQKKVQSNQSRGPIS
jgi:hypothetical protein